MIFTEVVQKIYELKPYKLEIYFPFSKFVLNVSDNRHAIGYHQEIKSEKQQKIDVVSQLHKKSSCFQSFSFVIKFKSTQKHELTKKYKTENV